MRLRPPAVLTLVAALLLGACGDSADDLVATSSTSTTLAPDPWREIEANYFAACTADTEGVDVGALDDYCQCTYREVVEFYGTVEAFAEADARLAADPEATDPRLDAAFAGCADLHLGAP